MRPDDLRKLGELLGSLSAVVPMKDVFYGDTDADVIAVRHDVDDNQGSWEAAKSFARWEYDHGYRTTYFLLHSASYWGQPWFWEDVKEIASLGHEIGIHCNAIAESVRYGGSPSALLSGVLREIRDRTGVPIIGEVAHGDELCKDPEDRSKYRFVNDEMFTECARPEMGAPDRIIKGTGLRLGPHPLSDYGLLYDSNRLPRRFYASDSGGRWSQPWGKTVEQGLSGEGQLHLLIHPDWWTEAF